MIKKRLNIAYKKIILWIKSTLNLQAMLFSIIILIIFLILSLLAHFLKLIPTTKVGYLIFWVISIDIPFILIVNIKKIKSTDSNNIITKKKLTKDQKRKIFYTLTFYFLLITQVLLLTDPDFYEGFDLFLFFIGIQGALDATLN